jgi:light-regulated signal transduction histidine kinase (bacteriophytochrome)
LTYSRVVNAESERAKTDSNEVLRSALANLSQAIQESNAVVTQDVLPLIRVNETQLVMLFQNLIANAIKYRRQEPPLVHVRAQQKDGTWVFSIEDNGMGIQPEYRHQIFTPFKRLHGFDRAGAGIGLATCKKIVERHGGRIWVESQPGCGSIFFFTLPCDL